MSKQKTSEWCGVRYCPSPSKVKGLCPTHYKEHMDTGVYQELVANDEITRCFLKPPAYSPAYYKVLHRKFSKSLPITEDQQRALTRALNKTAERRGVMK